jgi:hypothetical protein
LLSVRQNKLEALAAERLSKPASGQRNHRLQVGQKPVKSVKLIFGAEMPFAPKVAE